MPKLKYRKEALLDVTEVAELLNVKVSTIYQATHKRRIPHVKIGKLIRFRREDLDQWINSVTIPVSAAYNRRMS